GEVGAEGRVRGLILDDVGLARQRQPPEVVPRLQIAGRGDAGAGPRRAPERVAGRAVDLVQEGAQPAPLMLAQPRGLQRLERAVVHQARSLKRWILPVAVFGSSPTNSIQRGYLYGAILSLTKAFSSSARPAPPPAGPLSTTNALGFTSPTPSSCPTTAASSTA